MSQKFKIGYCPCGNKIVISSLMPYAEIDRESIKKFKELAKNNRKIEIVSDLDINKFSSCNKCYPEQLELINV